MMASDKVWQPLPDGRYDAQHFNHEIEVDRDYLKLSCPGFDGGVHDEVEVGLPDNMRLCQLVPAASAVPPEQLYCAKCGDGLDVEAVCSQCHWTLQQAYEEVAAKLDSAPAVPPDIAATMRETLMAQRAHNDEWGYQWGSDIQNQIYARLNKALSWLNSQEEENVEK